MVDCEPGNIACGGSHRLIQSDPATPEECPYDDIGPWIYCIGELLVGGGCTEYVVDSTVRFTCV